MHGTILFPRQLAIENNPGNKKILEERLKQVRKKEDKMLADMNSVIAKLKEGPLKSRCQDRNQRQDIR